MALASAILLGVYDIAKKVALKNNGVYNILLVATALSAVFVSPFITLGNFPDHLRLIFKAVLVTASWVSGMIALQLLPITTVSTFKTSRPMFVVLFSILLFGERLNWLQWIGVAAVLLALWLLSVSSSREGISFKGNRGFWALVVSIFLTGGLACAWAFPSAHVRLRVVRAATWAALIAGFAVAVYTGLLLSSMPAVPFWASPLLPILFTLSALSCGSALVLACAAVSGSFDVFSQAIGRTVWLDVAVMGLEALATALLIVSATAHPYGVSVQSADVLLTGPLQALFLLGFGGVGIAVPLVLESISALGRVRLSSIALTAASCVLVGGFILRYCIVAVGAHPEVWAVVS